LSRTGQANCRLIIDFEPCQWTLEQAAVYDHPQAVTKVIEMTGAKSIKAVVHCQGSTSFMMSAVAGLVPEVSTIISNAVSLHPIVPTLSKIKIALSAWPMRLLTPYINPQWGKNPRTLFAKVLNFVVNLLHKECDNAVCKHSSFLYGSGHPTLWRHENLNPETHAWLANEFGWLPTQFLIQIGRGIKKGELQAMQHLAQLPRNFVDGSPKTKARMAFFSGKQNVCFLPESQQKTFEYFDKLKPGYHSMTQVENYGHLCMFMGKDASRDVFPLMLAELDK